MGKIAFVFSGQGDQHTGMGAAVYNASAAAKNVFGVCETLRPGTVGQCFSGSEDALKETRNTQPCMFAVETAYAMALEACGLKADVVAGFSLGEVAALTYAGTFALEDGFKLVCRRGELMQQAADEHETSMAAILKLSSAQVEELCARFEGVYPVNYNSPGQVAVSGLATQMPAFFEAVKQAGGRAMPLKVKGAFHSPFMNGAAEAFSRELESVCINAPQIPVYSDVTARPYDGDIAPLLARQICSPVMWETIIKNMIASGVTAFIEIGPGKTLCNLIARIDKTARTFAVSAYEDMEKLVSEVKAC